MNNVKNKYFQGPEINPRMTIISFFLIVLSLSVPVFQVNADAGKLDPAFGHGGKVITDFGGQEYGGGMAIQSDGRIIVVGSTDIVKWSGFALARYLPNGHLDQLFGHGGKVTTDFFNGVAAACGIVIQPNGKVIVVGNFQGQSGERDLRFALARYLPNGALDRSFGNKGKVTTRLAGNFGGATGVALQPNGKIVVSGYIEHAGIYNFALVRYLPNGVIDENFGNHGWVLFSFQGTNQMRAVANAVAIQKDGKIVVAGWAEYDFNINNSTGTETMFAVARLREDGLFDETFGKRGRVITDFGNPAKNKFSVDRANSIAIQPDGRIVVAGTGIHGETWNDFVLVRYEKNGHLDQSFGVKGKAATDILGDNDGIRSIALQRNGDIIAAGYAEKVLGYTNYNMALARYKPDGQLDPDFGENGKLTTGFYGDDGAASVAVQKNGKIVVSGTAHKENTPKRDFALVRYLAR